MRLTSEQAAAGTIYATIEIRNRSQHDCDLYGFAGLQLLDARGRPLPTRAIWSKTSFFQGSPAVEAVIGLPAGTPPISTAAVDPQHPIPPVIGHAYIPLRWNDVLEPCSHAAKLRITPPDAFTALVISATMSACSGGTVYINPTRTAVSQST
jgi:hypothetical protein